MKTKKIAEPQVICELCGKIKGKHSQPFPRCSCCGKIMCYPCRAIIFPKYQGMCRKCQNETWHKEYQKEREAIKNTPVECITCLQKFLPDQMENSYAPTVCKTCATIVKRAKEAEKKRNAIHGQVAVAYGEHPVPTEDGGYGHAYSFDQPLHLGDVVECPRTWLGDIRGESGPNLATVVSTYSDYTGATSRIIRIIKRAQDR